GRVFATSDGDVVRLWETATGQEVFRRGRHGALPGAPPQAALTSVAFLPGGRRLATGLGDGTALVWDLAADAAAAGGLPALGAERGGGRGGRRGTADPVGGPGRRGRPPGVPRGPRPGGGAGAGRRLPEGTDAARAGGRAAARGPAARRPGRRRVRGPRGGSEGA